MRNRWSDVEAAEYVATHGSIAGSDLALRAYGSRLIGSEPNLVLYGGGNSSLKSVRRNVLGEDVPVLFVKPSGFDMSTMHPEDYIALDLDFLQRLQALDDLTDEQMTQEFRTRRLTAQTMAASIESLVHAFIPGKYIDHCHADAILTLTNQSGGAVLIAEALGPEVAVLEYVKPGFRLAQAAAKCFKDNPECRAMVWMRHGLMTWGDTARESYETTIELITRAEEFAAGNARKTVIAVGATPVGVGFERYQRAAPILRGLLAGPSGNPDRPFNRVILEPLITPEVLGLIESEHGRDLALSPPLTSDHLIRTKVFPAWCGTPDFSDLAKLRGQLADAVHEYAAQYENYVRRNSGRMPGSVTSPDTLPRVVLIPGLGAVCAGRDEFSAKLANQITAHTLAVKAQIAAMGSYAGMAEDELFEMEYRPIQNAKLGTACEPALAREVAVITGAAGAIGSGIAEELLAEGCHVAVTDLPGQNLNSVAEALRSRFGDRAIAVPMDVTDPDSVAAGFGQVVRAWGGIDLVVVNAGVALVSSLAEMRLESFRKLEKVNVEGTLLVLSEAGRIFAAQGTGGDIVLISTKNVFAPGAKFGAYSATKSAAHQLARIASLEFADMGVRVNMVSPDAVFSHGERKSGLWETVGPDRMKARGLDAQGLEEYYRSRNLLKAGVTARHVARATLFFATRQTPTTGATIPVDGGLPDATPR
jgi:rhamnose utilization protein RhaD (predicted bifunctional aldolase and dehydrogenase)/NAD(P)-dependent dehydrogenase (short-subunit alcohol dehydrogenase family)